jgi:hypothetical protein
MADPLLGLQPLVATHVPGSRLVSVGSWPAGPAGSVGLDLGFGVEIDVDAARPSCLVGLTIELPPADPPGDLPGGLRNALDPLLGRSCSDNLVGFLHDSMRDPMRAASARLAAPDHGRSVAIGAPDLADLPVDAPVSGVAIALQRAATAQGLACAPGVSFLVRAVGLLEAAVELSAVGRLLDLTSMVRRDLSIGVDVLLDAVAGGSRPRSGGHAARELAGLLRVVSSLTSRQSLVAARLTSLARELEPDRRNRRGARRLTTTEGPPVPRRHHDSGPAEDASARRRLDRSRPATLDLGRSSPLRRVPVDVGSLPGALAEAPIAAHRRGPAEVEVRIDGWAERRGGLWARTFHAGDGGLLAVAPFRADVGDAVARLLVPPDAIHRLEVDVTDRPELPRRSRALAAMERAIHVGRFAAQAGRLGDPASATQRWRQCARLWSESGDHERAELALGFGDRASDALRSSPRGQAHARAGPLVVDLVEVGA